MSSTSNTNPLKMRCVAIKQTDKLRCRNVAKCGSLYCGIHRNYKALSPITANTKELTEEEKEDMKYIKMKEAIADDKLKIKKMAEDNLIKNPITTFNFNSMTGDNLEVDTNNNSLVITVKNLLYKKYNISSLTKLSIFEEGKEEELKDNTKLIGSNTYFILLVENDNDTELNEIKKLLRLPLLEYLYTGYKDDLKNEKINKDDLTEEEHKEQYNKYYISKFTILLNNEILLNYIDVNIKIKYKCYDSISITYNNIEYNKKKIMKRLKHYTTSLFNKDITKMIIDIINENEYNKFDKFILDNYLDIHHLDL